MKERKKRKISLTVDCLRDCLVNTQPKELFIPMKVYFLKHVGRGAVRKRHPCMYTEITFIEKYP
jgi:hypothetical protein